MPLILLCIFLLASSGMLPADGFNDNILIYDQGDIQVSTTVDTYEQLTPGSPIKGSIMITRQRKDQVDANSFLLGDKPLKTEFIQSEPISSYDGSLVIDIYRFQTEGMDTGNHALPSIKVKINGKEYVAPPLSIQVS